MAVQDAFSRDAFATDVGPARTDKVAEAKVRLLGLDGHPARLIDDVHRAI